tara:strand:- start:363 stop:554 length:192 start_codon:yes stop_codon:yes gene_type:complete
MKEEKLQNLENLVSKLDNDRTWILKNIDKGKWSELRIELAALEREISKFILRAKEYNSKENLS